MTEQLFRTDIQVKSIDVEARTVDYIASTETVDSYGEIVEQDWILDRFNKNPVILYNHNRAVGGGFFGGGSLPPEATLPIGRSIEHGVVTTSGKTALRIRVQFAPADLNPFADKIFGLVREGYLKGGSVGFNPHDVRRETHDDVDTYILSKNELFEFSICPMGANPDAVSLSVDDIQSHRALLRQLATRSVTPTKGSPSMDYEKLHAEEKARAEKLASELESARRESGEKIAALEKSNGELSAQVADVSKANAEVVEKLASLEKSNTELTERLAAETKRADESENDLVVLEIDSLIGRKLTPAEKEDAITDRKREGKVAFAKRMEKRADLKLLENKTPTSGPVSTLSNTNPGQKTVEAVFGSEGAK
jgi:HK97 family phage prohead protease